jgi:hypothetical protein
MSDYRKMIGFLIISLLMASLSYAVSGQPQIAIVLILGLFPVVMSLAAKRR